MSGIPFVFRAHTDISPTTTYPKNLTQLLIISACAFDSVPADLGTVFAQKVPRNKRMYMYNDKWCVKI